MNDKKANTIYTAEEVEFYDDFIYAVKIGDSIEVVMKSLIENLGLNTHSALAAIRKDDILGPESTVRYVRVGEKQAINYLLVPIERIEGWLFSIQASKVGSEKVKQNLLKYKKECYNILHSHFRGNHRQLKENSQKRIKLKEELKQLNKRQTAIKKDLKKIEKNDRTIHLTLTPELFDDLTSNKGQAASDY